MPVDNGNAQTARIIADRKNEIVTQAVTELRAHIDKLDERMGCKYMPANLYTAARFAESIKGLKTLDSMRDKVSTALAHAKIEANEIADRIEANAKSLVADGNDWRHLFPDFAGVCTGEQSLFAMVLRDRIARENERKEAERERIRKEEEAKAQREAAATAQQTMPPESETGTPAGPGRLAPASVGAVVGGNNPESSPYAVRKQHTPDIKAWEEFKAGADMENGMNDIHLQCDGTTVYSLVHAGWNKGEELFKNAVWFGVYTDKESGIDAEDFARRIVACVNACAGIPTDLLEHTGGGLDSVWANLEQQRDKVLEALKLCRPYINAWPQCGHNLLPRVDAAIANAEGK